MNNESYYTYRPSDAVAVRAPHGIDVHAGYSPWHVQVRLHKHTRPPESHRHRSH